MEGPSRGREKGKKERHMDVIMEMDTRTQGVLSNLVDLCEKISMRKHSAKDDIFEFTKSGKYPPVVSRLAEAFGMMMVRLDAHALYQEGIEEELGVTGKSAALAGKPKFMDRPPVMKEVEGKGPCPITILGRSEEIRIIQKRIEKIADLSSNILITGETGTGKELIAKAIHYNSRRRTMPFIAINCAAVPEAIFESEIFGIEKGVATGVGKRIGKMEMACKGTLFFDEIGDMPLNIQAKVLRVIEDRQIERLGARKPIPVDIRIVAATNKNLKEEVKEERFREDLFYRLNVIQLHIPPLRERKEDIPILADHFLKECNRTNARDLKRLSRTVLDFFMDYPWPGNVRELRNEVERATALSCSNTITVRDLSEDLKDFLDKQLLEPPTPCFQKGEKEVIVDILRKTNGNKTRAAGILGISREGLRKKMKRLNLISERKEFGFS